ncbi:MAG: DUF6702 family protein [Pseudomonadota bacterium]
MMPSWRALAAALVVALLMASAAARAHDFHAGLTDISYNARTGSIEIVHTYMAHDIDALFANLYQRPPDLAGDEDEALLRRYLERQFYLTGANGTRLPVRWVGLKAEADTVTVFQEVVKTALPSALSIHDQVLVDFIATQVNTVNVARPGAPATLVFDQKTAERKLP